MRILITGADGMLASNVIKNWRNKYDLYLTGKRKYSAHSDTKYLQFDLKSPRYDYLLNWSKPDLILHCAAITHVDYCETNHADAMNVNSLSCKKLTEKNKYTKKFIYISTDAVFDGTERLPDEASVTNPVNYYGYTKLLGENYVALSGIPFSIVRTTILGKNYSSPSKTLAEWIYTSLKQSESIKLFSDAYFTPITVSKLIDEIETIIHANIQGLFHVTGTSLISKYEFGCQLAAHFGLDQTLIKESSLSDVDFKAPRSFDQSLCVDKYQKLTSRILPAINNMINDFNFPRS